jgi:hypothetical protein
MQAGSDEPLSHPNTATARGTDDRQLLGETVWLMTKISAYNVFLYQTGPLAQQIRA